ncbi:uncharacterized protein LOC119730737 [Patiria miniata]|uniref:PAW domain-containing protein n=1 Tax=Patiria miniata TaxID=46514 RepID=A0A914A8D1_PATMI|nr:uncharacterized protein LOC119730737 [Patiria miniata]
MKGRKRDTLPSKADPMKLTWTRDSVVSLKREDEVRTQGHVFTLTECEIERKVFNLRYHTCNDAYYRLGSDEAVIDGWENGIYAAVNVERHVDHDLAYLTRADGHRDASISWKVDLTGTGLVVDSIQALTLSRTLRGGMVTYDIVSPDAEQAPEQSGYKANGWQTLYLIAYLSGSRTEDTYDQTQLLYQSSLDDQDNFPLDILITLKPLQEILCTCTPDSEQSHKEGIQELVEIHLPPIEKCTCYFPNNHLENCPDANEQRTPVVADSVDGAQSIEDLSIVNNHAISLPGTPIHRKHYGSRASSGSSRSHKLSKRNRVQSSEPSGYDNSGAESPIRVHALRHVTSSEQFEMQELEVCELEKTSSRLGAQTSEARKAWTDGKQRDSESLVGDDDTGSTRRFCKGSLCTIS